LMDTLRRIFVLVDCRLVREPKLNRAAPSAGGVLDILSELLNEEDEEDDEPNRDDEEDDVPRQGQPQIISYRTYLNPIEQFLLEYIYDNRDLMGQIVDIFLNSTTCT